MNTEEKAKAYDEALKRAKAAFDIAADKDLVGGVVRTIFPELRESEDERIRKEIIDFIQWAEDRGMTRHDYHQAKRPAVWIAYLEKQKECVADSSKTSVDEDESIRKFLVDYFTSYKIGNVATKLNGVRIDDILNYLEKQKETLHILEMCKENANSFTDGVIEVRSFQRGLEEGKRLERQKENSKSADSISSDCESNAKCEYRWHKVEDSLPDNGRLVLANDCLGNTLLARYDGEGNWEVSVYDNDDYYCRNTITKWCEIPSEKQKEQKPDSLIYDKDLDKAAREFYLSGGAASPVDSTGLVPIVRMAEFGATWMKERMEKEQKPCWNPTEEDVALFNKAIITNASLSPQERAKLDILRMKFKHRPVIEQKEQKPAVDDFKAKDWYVSKVDGKIHNIYHSVDKIEQKPDIELIQKSWYMEGYHDKEFNCEPKWIIKTGEGGPRYEENPKYGQIIEQKPAEWSEEDERMRNLAIEWAEIMSGQFSFVDMDSKDFCKITAWLKSLRPSWKPSEQEKGALRTAIHILTEERSFPKAAGHLQAILDAFDGKESRKNWKPSEAQLMALHSVIDDESDTIGNEQLKLLYEQLKKLM